MSNNSSSYKGFYQAGLSMSSNLFGHDLSYNRSESQIQPSYYSAIDKTYPVQDSMPSQQLFGQDHGTGYKDQSYYNTVHSNTYNQLPINSSQASYGDYSQQDMASAPTYCDQQTRDALNVNLSSSEPVFGIDFSDETQKKQWERFQHHFQQAFEQQLTHQIHLQIQQQGAYNSRQSGNLGSSAVDGVSVFFGDDSVGKKKGEAVGYGGNRDDGRVVVGEGQSSASNSSSRSASHPGHSKFYCATCDISYANSLAFTSHLGSSDHKMQREKEARRPKPAMSASPRPPSQLLPAPPMPLSSSRKEISCQLCNVTCSGADVYAQHMKSEEHQRILRMNSDHRKRIHDRAIVPIMPLPEEFGMNFDKTRGFGDTADQGSIGLEFVEEMRDPYGNIVRVVCNLCKVEIPNPSVRRMHLQSQQHRMLYEQRMANEGLTFGQDFRGINKSPFGGTVLFGQPLEPQRSFGGFGVPCFGTDLVNENSTTIGECAGKRTTKETDDDECIRQKHSLIYPTTDDFRAVQKVSGSCDRWLKTIANNLMDASKRKLISTVAKVGNLAKGLLLHYDLSCDLLVLTHDWPTRSLIRSIYNELEVLREKNTKDDQSEFELTISDGEELITLENLWQPLVRCNILVSSHSVREAKELTKEVDNGDRLRQEMCLQHLNLLDQTKWFQTKANPLPSCVLVVRVFKDLRQGNKEFICLTDEVIERLVASTIKSQDSQGGPGMILKKSLELLVSSLHKLDHEIPKNDEDGEKVDLLNVNKCKNEASQGTSADEVPQCLSRLTSQEKEDVIKLAENLLNKISLGKMKEILHPQKLDPNDQPPTKAEETEGKSTTAEGSTFEDDKQQSHEMEGAKERGVENLDGFNLPPVKKLKVEL